MREFLKNHPFWRNTLCSAAVHAAVVCALLIWSVASCVMRRKPREITTFVDLQMELPPMVAAVNPTPPPPPPPEPAPIPMPEPEKPKPAQPKPAPKPEKPKVEVSRKIVRRNAPTNAPPRINQDQIRQMLAKALPDSGRAGAPASEDLAFGWYLALVRNALYEAWNQPSALAGRQGLTTQVALRVRRDGTVAGRTMTRSAGNPLMDQSVMQAVESVASLPALPPGFGGDYKDITVDFELAE